LLTQKGAALFGYTDLYGGYAGGQAEAVRVPYADFGPRKVPPSLSDEQVLFLSDILPTGWAAIDWADMKGGETVAVFGCGPVGLMAQKAAWVRGAARVIAVDVRDYRLEMARKVANADTVNAVEVDCVEAIRSMTGGRGADVCVDAVGMEVDRGMLTRVANVMRTQAGSITSLELCVRAARRGGAVPAVGVYGTLYDNFPLGRIVDKGLLLRFGQAPVHNYIDQLLRLIVEGKLRADDIITHVLPLNEAPLGYEVFNTKTDGCVKVVLKP
jgi:threonine dehydrogenase-like Zn-dependent dehydrogenase